MASNYPTSLDSFNNPSGTDSLNSPSHSLQHADINDAVEALEAKIGIGDSPAGSATAGQVLTAQGGGTAIWASGGGGLAFIETISFSSVSSASFSTNAFTASYDEYLIKFIISNNSTATGLRFRFRAAGTDDNGNNYTYSLYRLRASGAALAADLGNPTSSFAINSIPGIAGTYTTGTINLFKPLSAGLKSYNVLASGTDGTSQIFSTGSGYNTNATSFDSASLLPSSGTFSGEMSVYGYKD